MIQSLRMLFTCKTMNAIKGVIEHSVGFALVARDRLREGLLIQQ
jgi:hypothetical protein